MALAGATLEIGVGECVLITGPSGAGKSTLLRLIALHDRPTSGRIVIGGTDLSQVTTQQLPAYRRRVPLVFQELRLLPAETVLANTALPLRVAGYLRSEWAQAAREVLDKVGLPDGHDRRVRDLSLGEQRLVALARALIVRPDVLLADEPVAHLDQRRSGSLIALLRRLAAEGTTVVIAGHHAEAQLVGSLREIRLEEGRLAEAPND
jgi:cell division transport system ATP-binding protein